MTFVLINEKRLRIESDWNKFEKYFPILEYAAGQRWTSCGITPSRPAGGTGNKVHGTTR